MLLAKPSQGVRQKRVYQGTNASDHEAASLSPCRFLRERHSLLSGLQGASRASEKSSPNFSQLDPPRIPFHELQVKFIFEILNLLAERRVRDMEPTSGSAEAKFLSHGHEVTQVTQLH
jgi:hypothetical protein